jgi:hypothetical protein
VRRLIDGMDSADENEAVECARCTLCIPLVSSSPNGHWSMLSEPCLLCVFAIVTSVLLFEHLLNC